MAGQPSVSEAWTHCLDLFGRGGRSMRMIGRIVAVGVAGHPLIVRAVIVGMTVIVSFYGQLTMTGCLRCLQRDRIM